MTDKILSRRYRQLLIERRPHESRTPEVDMRACERINDELKEVRRVMALTQSLTLTEQLALAVFEGFEADKNLSGDAVEAAVSLVPEASGFARVFGLAAHWSNDLASWADEVLSGSTWE